MNDIPPKWPWHGNMSNIQNWPDRHNPCMGHLMRPPLGLYWKIIMKTMGLGRMSSHYPTIYVKRVYNNIMSLKVKSKPNNNDTSIRNWNDANIDGN